MIRDQSVVPVSTRTHGLTHVSENLHHVEWDICVCPPGGRPVHLARRLVDELFLVGDQPAEGDQSGNGDNDKPDLRPAFHVPPFIIEYKAIEEDEAVDCGQPNYLQLRPADKPRSGRGTHTMIPPGTMIEDIALARTLK